MTVVPLSAKLNMVEVAFAGCLLEERSNLFYSPSFDKLCLLANLGYKVSLKSDNTTLRQALHASFIICTVCVLICPSTMFLINS